MIATHQRGVFLGAAVVALSCVIAVTTHSASQFPIEPLRESGQGVTAAYEGWFKNPDGTFSLLIGYYNRNLKQPLEIPIGPDNRIEPGGPDQGQPAHFLPRRQWGVFVVTVPADFGDRTLTWTLVANGKTTAVPMGLNRQYEVSPFKDAAQGNTPPVLRLEPGGAPLQGPPRGIARSFNVGLSDRLLLSVWATDDGIVTPERRAPEFPVSITWSKFRGPGAVTFVNARPPLDKASGRGTTGVTFSEPGDYLLRAYGTDASSDGGGGFQCCWTTALVRVSVR